MSKREPPEICDYDCPFADFPPAVTSGICRTMSAVYCGKLKEYVNKNIPCTWRARQADGKKKPTAANPRARLKVAKTTKKTAKKGASRATAKKAGAGKAKRTRR